MENGQQKRLEIVRHVKFLKTGEKKFLEKLISECSTEQEARERVAQEYDLSITDAYTVVINFKSLLKTS